ncbi:MAG: biotin--[acetyl-CoA-carboxylase] ligase [Bacteroidales bacterium]|nr:biotin--[acetyl-CoA-carboxylase] ligase [Bacteroidales bacterium]
MNVIWYDTLDSTNSEALRHLQDFPGGTVLVAREQTAGRGQRGNTWFSEPGKNLTFSIVLKFGQDGVPDLAAKDVMWLTYLTSYTLALFLRSFGVGCDIKWPNDIYVQKHKICGMLIENTLKGENLDAAVIGIGLNINQREFPQLAMATSLVRCYGKETDLETCLQKFLRIFEEEFPLIFDERERAALFRGYSHQLYGKDRNCRYYDCLRDKEYWGILQGVEPDGRLCIWDLESEGKPMRYYWFKEVSFVL